MRVMVFAPHPDDESIGMGGTIYKHTQGGDEVYVIFMTDGSGGGFDIEPEKLVKIREEEAKEACNVLGVSKIEFLRFKDGALFLNYETISRVAKLIRTFKPDRIYIPHGDAVIGEDNLDHINTYRIVREAIFKTYLPHYAEFGKEAWNVREVYAYETLTPMRDPTSFVDITDVLHKKLEAISKHKSQIAWADWKESIVAWNRVRGIISGVGQYVEAFKAVRTTLF